MKIDIQSDIRIPKDPSTTWGRYVGRGLAGGFNFDVPGAVLVPVGQRVNVYLHGQKVPVATAIVTLCEISFAGEPAKLETGIMFDKTVLLEATKEAS